MTERLDYYDEQKERNSTARSARMRPGGKKKYLLPSDKLSAGEIKKLNGEITVYTMKEPISLNKFRGYPKDIQKEYLKWFVDEFGATARMMAKVFGVSDTYMCKVVQQMNLNGLMPRSTTVEKRLQFEAWLSQYRPQEETKQTVVEEPKKEKAKVVEQPMFFNTITGCEMSMEGKASEIGQMLFNLFRDQKVCVNISFVGEKESVIEDAEMD